LRLFFASWRRSAFYGFAGGWTTERLASGIAIQIPTHSRLILRPEKGNVDGKEGSEEVG
jgi:hypothetical protein